MATLSVRSVDVYAELGTTSVHLQFFNAISHSGLLKNVHGSWVESQGVCVGGGSICIHILYVFGVYLIAYRRAYKAPEQGTESLWERPTNSLIEMKGLVEH